MKYHLTLMSKQQPPESSYEGPHLGTHRIRLSHRFAARLLGVRRVMLSYDAKARIICPTPLKTQKSPAGPDTCRMTKNARGATLMHCSTLSRVDTQRTVPICLHRQQTDFCAGMIRPNGSLTGQRGR
jgi:hypothetical protein